jgi:hypothetical protein
MNYSNIIEDGNIIPLNIEIQENSTINDLIRISLNAINTYLENIKSNKRLKYNIDNYQIKPSKKNGQPKLDLPALNKQTLVSETQINSFSLIYKPEDVIILINNKEENSNNNIKRECCGCMLF